MFQLSVYNVIPPIQADKMAKRNRSDLQEVVGDNEGIPAVDRGRSDPQNILGVVIKSQNGQYKIAV